MITEMIKQDISKKFKPENGSNVITTMIEGVNCMLSQNRKYMFRMHLLNLLLVAILFYIIGKDWGGESHNNGNSNTANNEQVRVITEK